MFGALLSRRLLGVELPLLVPCAWAVRSSGLGDEDDEDGPPSWARGGGAMMLLREVLLPEGDELVACPGAVVRRTCVEEPPVLPAPRRLSDELFMVDRQLG